MPMLAVNPAAFRFLLTPLVAPANKNLSTCNGGGGRRPSYGVLRSSRLAAMAADFFRQNTDENVVLERVCRLGSRLGSGTASGLFLRPAAARSSASAWPPCGLGFPSKSCSQTTPEKIPPEPP